MKRSSVESILLAMLIECQSAKDAEWETTDRYSELQQLVEILQDARTKVKIIDLPPPELKEIQLVFEGRKAAAIRAYTARTGISVSDAIALFKYTHKKDN